MKSNQKAPWHHRPHWFPSARPPKPGSRPGRRPVKFWTPQQRSKHRISRTCINNMYVFFSSFFMIIIPNNITTNYTSIHLIYFYHIHHQTANHCCSCPFWKYVRPTNNLVKHWGISGDYQGLLLESTHGAPPFQACCTDPWDSMRPPSLGNPPTSPNYLQQIPHVFTMLKFTYIPLYYAAAIE